MIWEILFTVVQWILYPVDALIRSLLPDISNAMSNFGQFISMITSSLGWVISLSGLPAIAISLVASYLIFKLTAPVFFWLFKLILKWIRQLH